ncbi:MAG: hypothetical protein KIT72_07070 [Polyangiaceae bacterium]|nr:hypothetical protein [Polyangiaceae bacterium]MCW5790164.1 hypothetical protein [Polyangiaceae bacterium]
MIDVKEVLRRWQAGQSARQIERERVMSRRTAARYIKAAQEIELTKDGELTDEVLRAMATPAESAGHICPSHSTRLRWLTIIERSSSMLNGFARRCITV